VLLGFALIRSKRKAEEQKIYLTIPSHASITQSASKEGVTLQIFVRNTPQAK
jgi:hypothetical protein